MLSNVSIRQSDTMANTARVVGDNGTVGGEASIQIEGSGRSITIPKAMKFILQKRSWQNGTVLMIYNEKKDCLEIYSKSRFNEILKNAAGLIWQYKGTIIKENCS